MSFIRWATIALLLVPIIGCNNSPAVPAAPTATPVDVDEQPVAVVPVVEVDVKSWDEIQKWVASQTGKVVVVDVWSTSCLPCVKEFPNFVALHKELGGEIACASLNIDYYGAENESPEDLKPQILKFLTSKRATMQNFISSDSDEEIHKQIDTAAIPAVLVYDRDGNLHMTFNNDDALYGPEGFNYADHITPLVRELLK